MKSLVNTDYLKQAAELFQPIKQRSFELMNIEPGHKVLDVGCGNGADLAALRKYKRGVNAVGIDTDESMVIEANEQLTSDSNYATLMSIESLSYRNGLFDSVRAERVFMHLDNPAKALDEMIRVTKPGGRVVIVETDWASLSLAAVPQVTERFINTYRISEFLRNGMAGRYLYGMLKSRLDDVRVEITPLHTHELAVFDVMSLNQDIEAEIISKHPALKSDLRELRTNMEGLNREGAFFAGVNILTVSGTKKGE